MDKYTKEELQKFYEWWEREYGQSYKDYEGASFPSISIMEGWLEGNKGRTELAEEIAEMNNPKHDRTTLRRLFLLDKILGRELGEGSFVESERGQSNEHR